MKKKILYKTAVTLASASVMIAMFAGCSKNTAPEVTSTPAISLDSVSSSEPAEVSEPGEETVTGTETEIDGKLTDDQLLSAIRNYCFQSNPDLKDIVDEGEYTTYWEIEPGHDNETVVLFRSYTGAQIRYYINPASGDTYVTEFVPGITDEEQKTDESFNVNDYLQ